MSDTPIVLAAATPAAQPSAAATLNPAAAAQLQQFQFPTIPKTPLAQHLPWLTHLFAAAFVTAAILLVILLAVQTTRQEGLTGTLGGRVDSSYRGRLGMEGQIARFTAFIAIAYVVVATIISISGI
ncbi:MAG TPA: preprotein translocase subunit SecG [Candidatus Binatia bacterium]|nr:preprotein translocase subunit SecG [Candidatus Binatia bacterium]